MCTPSEEKAEPVDFLKTDFLKTLEKRGLPRYDQFSLFVVTTLIAKLIYGDVGRF